MSIDIAERNLTQTRPEDFSVIFRQVHPALRQTVMHISGFVGSGAAPVRNRELPFVGTPIIFSFGAPYRLSDASDPDSPIHKRTHFVAGLHETWSTSESTGPGWSIQVNLTPPGAHFVLGLPLHELTNRIVAFDDVCGATGRQLVTDLEQSTGWDERFDLIEAFLIFQQNRGPRLEQSILWSWQEIERAGGLARIGSLADELGWSRRHFATRFREQIGMSPKLVARQIRFTSATNLLVGTDQPLAGIASGLGFSDQAHLTREFRSFAGETPGQFRAGRRIP